MTSSDSSETASDSLIIGILDDIREHVQLADLPEDLLAAIVRFADLEARAAGVAVCRALRSASERLSPRLEYSLVLRRFPLAASIVGAETPTTTNAPSPRGLFRTFANFEALGRDECQGKSCTGLGPSQQLGSANRDGAAARYLLEFPAW